MKHIKLFEQFINEAYSSDKVKDEIVKLFIKAGFTEPEIFSSSISTVLPNDTKKAPPEIVKLEKEIKKWAKSNDGVLTTKTAVGYSSGNDFSV